KPQPRKAGPVEPIALAQGLDERRIAATDRKKVSVHGIAGGRLKQEERAHDHDQQNWNAADRPAPDEEEGTFQAAAASGTVSRCLSRFQLCIRPVGNGPSRVAGNIVYIAACDRDESPVSYIDEWQV